MYLNMRLLIVNLISVDSRRYSLGYFVIAYVAAVTYLRLATKNDARNIVCMDLKRSSWMGQELLFFLNGS